MIWTSIDCVHDAAADLIPLKRTGLLETVLPLNIGRIIVLRQEEQRKDWVYRARPNALCLLPPGKLPCSAYLSAINRLIG